MEKIHKILAVDDDELNLIYYEYSLRSPELLLLKAKSGAEAIEIIKAERDISLILLDVQMPVMDGYQTLKKIRALEEGGDIPVILITAINKTDEHIDKGYKLGASDYIIKPIQGNTLKNKILVFLKVQFEKQRLNEYSGRILEEKEFVAQVLNNVPSYLIVVDEELRLINSNITEEDFSKKYNVSGFNIVYDKVRVEIEQICKQVNSINKEINISGVNNKVFYFNTVVSSFVGSRNQIFVLITLTDISHIKQIESELESQLLFMTALIESIPGPVFYKDKNGIYLGCNSHFEEFIGLSKSEIIGKSVYDISEKEIADKYYEMDKQLLDSSGMQIYEGIVKYADGSLKNVMFYKSVFCDANGTVSGLIGLIVDISERKKAEVELHETNRSLKILGECNIALLTAEDEKELYFAFTEILTSIGSYPFVSITKKKSDDSGEAAKPILMAESGNHISDNKEASIVIPVKSKSRSDCTINLFCDDEGKFDDAEKALLNDIASYLAYGLDSLYDKRKRAVFEEQLANEKEELSVTLKYKKRNRMDCRTQLENC